MNNMTIRPFTGYHMAAILIGFFGIVIAVNIFMARVAIGSFGGTVVENSYVASQNYNLWLAEADKEAKLGWSAIAKRTTDNRVAIQITDNGALGVGFAVTANAVHPLGRAPEQRLQFNPAGNGKYRSATALPSGRWLLHIEVRRGNDLYRTIAEVP